MEGGAKPGIGVRNTGVGAEPVEAEKLRVVGEKGGAGGIARRCVGDSVGEGVGKGRGDGGGGKQRGESGVGRGVGVDEEEGAGMEGRVGGLEGREEGAKTAVDGYPSGGLVLPKEVKGSGASRWGGGCGGRSDDGLNWKGGEGESGGGGGKRFGGGWFWR